MIDARFPNEAVVEGPVRARPAFVAWQAGGRQEFPNDPMLDTARRAANKRAGLIVVRRRELKEAA